MKRQDIKKDYLWNSVGVFVQNALSPILIIIITRLNGIDDSGLFSFAFSLAVVFWMIGMWGGRTYQVSDAKKEFTTVEYLSVRLLLSVLIVVGAIIFSIANQYDPAKTTLIIALVVFKSLESIADAIYGILQVHGRLYIAGKSLVYKTMLGLVGFVIIDYFTGSMLLASLALIIANIIIICMYDIPSSERVEKIHFKETALHYIGRAIAIMTQCWPIFIVMFLTVFSLNIPRYFIDKFHPSEIGYFGILAMPVTLITLVMSFVLQPNVVELSVRFNKREYAKVERNVWKIVLFTTLIGIIVLIGAWFIGVWALELVFGVSFENYTIALMLIVLGAILNAYIAIFVNVFVIMRRFKEQFYILLITNALLACVAGNIVESAGLVGAILLFVGTNIVQALLLIIYFTIYLRKKVETQ